MSNGNDILMGSGVSSAKFPTIGAVVTGTVVREPEAQQQKNFRTGVPEVWKDGSPKMMVVVQLKTNERDPQKPEDDGTRALYIAGKYLTNAVRDAVRASGANGIHTGGILTVQYIADGPAENGLERGPKLYAAQYQAPAVSFNGVTGPASAAPAYQQAMQPVQQMLAQAQQPATPVQQQMAPSAAPQQMPPVQQQVAASVLGVPSGVDPATWERLDEAQRQRVMAAMGTPAGQPGF